jgi:N-acetylmuramoyl-L-alanine amidase
VNRDDITHQKPIITISDGSDRCEYSITEEIRVLTPDRPVTVRTRNNAFLNESWGGDRLGGSKINMLDSGICMQVIGKSDALYKVRLGVNHSAYIPENVVELLPDGYYPPLSLSGSWTVALSGKFDVITIPLPARHPYTIYQEVEPNRLLVDLYGVVCNSNWVTQVLNVKEIERVDLRQIAPDVLRFIIDLKDKTPWGYQVSYSGNNLLIKIKHKPQLTGSGSVTGMWNGLIFAVDAGHGGEEAKGAVSPSGYIEQYQNLAMSYMLKEMLEKRGAKVVLTRPQDKNVEMVERKKIVNDAQADFLISIHCNAGGNPLRTGGTSTYYKHIGYRPLSTAILKRMLELPIVDFGNIGHFNFSLNAVTECPNVLVETLFMSSLPDEELIADVAFQRKMMEKVVLGVEDYLLENL